jgi:hypothetical protein
MNRLPLVGARLSATGLQGAPAVRLDQQDSGVTGVVAALPRRSRFVVGLVVTVSLELRFGIVANRVVCEPAG